MILVGQYDSPFVRRVAVTLHHYAIPFTRDRTSVFSAEMAHMSPLVRIPTLVLDDGEALFDSHAILDHLDEQVPPERALLARSGPLRRRVLRATVLATGAIEKAGAVVYERHLHTGACVSTEWVTRCLGQLAGALAYLEREAAWPWFFGEQLTQADVTLGCLIGYLHMRLAEAFPRGRYPALEGVVGRCDSLEAFRATVPAPDEVMPAAGTARRA
jgi:glutathione S-transferase